MKNIFVILLFILTSCLFAQETSSVKSVLIVDGDTVVTKSGEVIEGEWLNFSGQGTLITTRIESGDSTVKVWRLVDSNFTYQYEVVDTILIETEQQIRRTKVGTSKQEVSAVSNDGGVYVLSFDTDMTKESLLNLENYRAINHKEYLLASGGKENYSYEQAWKDGKGVKPFHAVSTNHKQVVLFWDLVKHETYQVIIAGLHPKNVPTYMLPMVMQTYTHKPLYYSDTHRLAVEKGELW